MKITVVTSPFGALPPVAIGAVEKLFYQLAGEWIKAGHEVSFVCAGGGNNPSIKHVRLALKKRTGSTLWDLIPDFFYSLKALWKMSRTDILLCNTFWSPALAPLFRWKYKRLVYGVHRFPKRQCFLYPLVHAYICVSTYIKESLLNQFICGRQKVEAIVNPVNDKCFHYIENRSFVKGRVFYAGRICKEKGLEVLAKACAILNEKGLCSELLIAGSSDVAKGGGGTQFEQNIQKWAAPCPVRFVGAISDPVRLAEEESQAHVFCYPSEDNGEACPVAPMEAMGLGVPTVVSTLRCFADYAIDNETVAYFTRGDMNSCFEVLERVIMDAFFAMRLSRNGAEKIKEFSVPQVAGRYLDAFNALIK